MYKPVTMSIYYLLNSHGMWRKVVVCSVAFNKFCYNSTDVTDLCGSKKNEICKHLL